EQPPKEQPQNPKPQTPSHKALEIDKTNIDVIYGQNGTIAITSGNGEYDITPSDEKIITYQISEDNTKITITAKHVGEGTLSITDKKTKETKKVNVRCLTNPEHYRLNDNKTELLEWKDKTATTIDMKNDPILKNVVILKNNFNGCSKLSRIEFPDKLTTIIAGAEFFQGCTALTEITLPESISDLSNTPNMFQNSSIKSVFVLAKTPPKLNAQTVIGLSEAQIFVPEESFQAYKAAPLWQYLNILSFAKISKLKN
ncbi:MAG: leucine-rich repeat protein, partial [Flavobacteriaceae bacterium]|nr:leucine-rich repeat protein [Flavobacteriaceae bacterium]